VHAQLHSVADSRCIKQERRVGVGRAAEAGSGRGDGVGARGDARPAFNFPR
jgi:hypothetical protein